VNAVSKVQTYKQFGNSVSMPVLQAIATELSNRLINLKVGSAKD
jgi:site-specific DNA-cytosine methylase